MTKTANYEFSKWEKHDRVLMDDFNGTLDDIDAALKETSDAIPKIVCGSYTGNGKYGAGNPNSLSFPFTPKLVLISSCQSLPNSRQNLVGWFYGYNSGACDNDSNARTVKLSWTTGALQWYSTESAYDQLNQSNNTYQYCAIG